ncbi:MAG: Smr/MutS family protein [Proteobacteria bacterium]|nr:Smr/MutS family protein [Pseudomonadota bacterium]MBU1737501.1 Smr/MutS family protein [Pseudomonadota bacterium]
MQLNDSDPVEIEIDGVLDLHTFQPRDAKDVVIDYLEACHEQGINQIRIIHGKGTGTLRDLVHLTLEKLEIVQAYKLAGEDGGSWGATIVDLNISTSPTGIITRE